MARLAEISLARLEGKNTERQTRDGMGSRHGVYWTEWRESDDHVDLDL